MLSLARGPEKRVICRRGYYVNGFKFHIIQRGESKKTQHSGVVVKGESQNGEIDYYGVLTNVFELRYPTGDKVVLFKCTWYDVLHSGSGFKIDKFGYTSLNTLKKLGNNDPFVLASQAKQVFYAKGIKDPNWHIPMKTNPRNCYDILQKNDERPEDENAYQEDSPIIFTTLENIADDENEEDVWKRNDVGGEFIASNDNETSAQANEDLYEDEDGMSVEDDDDISVQDDNMSIED